jgi:hypothetical protein
MGYDGAKAGGGAPPPALALLFLLENEHYRNV